MSDDTHLMTKVQELADRAEILDCLHRYTRGMDRLDRELARSAYHDDAIDIHLTIVATVDEFLDWAFKYHAKQSCHQHYITNHTVELAGDTAHAETYYLFVGSYPNDERPVTVAGGRYIDRLERRDGRWAIAARVCTAEWEHRVESCLQNAPLGPDVLANGLIMARDRTDVSYDRPLDVR